MKTNSPGLIWSSSSVQTEAAARGAIKLMWSKKMAPPEWEVGWKPPLKCGSAGPDRGDTMMKFLLDFFFSSCERRQSTPKPLPSRVGYEIERQYVSAVGGRWGVGVCKYKYIYNIPESMRFWKYINWTPRQLKHGANTLQQRQWQS